MPGSNGELEWLSGSGLYIMLGLIDSLLTLNLIDELTETRGRGNKECVRG